MREILFRGKSVNDGRWIYGDLSNYGDYKTITTLKDFSIIDSCEVIPETVGQYTGLKDVHCKRVFEGDIVRYCDRLGYQMYQESIEDQEAYDNEIYDPGFRIGAVVYYTDDFSGFDLSDHNFDCNGLSELVCSGDYFYEVIGNIWDNPELLEGDKT